MNPSLHPKDLSISDYTYVLPDDRIAKYPLAERDQSKLLIYREGTVTEDTYAHLTEHLPANSLLIFNNTKVVEARLLFQKVNGSIIEIFCLEPAEKYLDITTAMLQKEKVTWKCLVGGAKKWKEGPLTYTIRKHTGDIILTACKKEQLGNTYLIELSWNDTNLSFAEILHDAGVTPLPPYLNRSAEDADKERYQTVYARYDGSVAAPTAGLHFTDTLLQALVQKNILHSFVTLHVGAGTFKPVTAATMQAHEMHAEFIEVDLSFIVGLLTNNARTIVAVGTTSLRTIESLYWMGVKTMRDPAITPGSLPVTQWEPYELADRNMNRDEALRSLLTWMQKRELKQLITKTQIIIAPGYRFRVAEGLITNFHQPQSTLLLLVAAFIGNDWRKVYAHALTNGFRFLSYGDGSLLWKKEHAV